VISSASRCAHSLGYWDAGFPTISTPTRTRQGYRKVTKDSVPCRSVKVLGPERQPLSVPREGKLAARARRSGAHGAVVATETALLRR